FYISIRRRTPPSCLFERPKQSTFESIGTRQTRPIRWSRVPQCLHARASARRSVRADSTFMPAKMVHEAWLPADSLTFITVDGAWDVNWVEGPPTTADLIK